MEKTRLFPKGRSERNLSKPDIQKYLKKLINEYENDKDKSTNENEKIF